MIINMSDLPQVLDTHQNENNRIESLIRCFEEKYNEKPAFIGRAPGRVNLIGEHIDYCGYGVLPMAIEQDVLIAVSCHAESEKISVANTDFFYNECVCDKSALPINKEEPLWHNYVLCGIQGIVDYCQLSSITGMNLLVSGNVPPCAGLSSSSAVVCCSALVTMHANGLSLSKKELAEIAADCENYIATSTEGGGMDQAISFLAEENMAQKIDFNPLRTRNVYLPDGITFVLLHSCVEIHKGETAIFNVRVIECRLAAQIVAKLRGLEWKEVKTLHDLQIKLGLSIKEALNIVKDILHKEPYTKDEICGILGVTVEDFNETCLIAHTQSVKCFMLYERACHVYSEALRVEEFTQICEEKPSDMLESLGRLLIDSHISCRDVFDCSCVELDDLVDMCLESGAYGARLTGAGWGGCAVAMVPTQQVEDFMEQVKDKFYLSDSTREEKFASSVFISRPSGGAVIYSLKNT